MGDNTITITRHTNSSIGGTGGGVYVNGVTFTMNGGTISGNEADNGGGVSVDNNGTFNMSGGNISSNTAEYGGSKGGAVSVIGGTFNMSGGTINGNEASYGGGGVYVATNGTFDMSGGTINGNQASGGGGVYVDRGTFNMRGSSIISGNKATAGASGGGVLVGSNGTFDMSGGTISGNEATAGGGVYVFNNGIFKKTGASIIYGDNNTTHGDDTTENTATGGSADGHAVYVARNSTTNDRYRNTTAGPGVDIDTSDPAQMSIAQGTAPWEN